MPRARRQMKMRKTLTRWKHRMALPRAAEVMMTMTRTRTTVTTMTTIATEMRNTMVWIIARVLMQEATLEETAAMPPPALRCGLLLQIVTATRQNSCKNWDHWQT